jgi:glycosyltransferase involved in cell wall biosynthesis
VTLGLDTGGQEKLLVEFARHADRQRVDLRFICLGGRGRLAEDIERWDWPVIALDEPPGLRPTLAVRLAQLFRRERLDVVHTHDVKPIVYGAPAARLARVPRVIHTRHGRTPHTTGRQKVLVNLAARMVDQFVCVSEDSARLTLEEGIPPAKVLTLRNGIDVTQFGYSGSKREGPAVCVARLSPEKDLGTLLNAAALVARVHTRFRLEIAGDGPCLPNLRRMVNDLGLGRHVCLLGEVRDVPALLARARLFVLSSVSEGISLTLLEAMARGLPVAATRVGGTPELVVDGESGLLVPAQDPSALAGAIIHMIRHPEESRRMGRAGRRRIELHFDVRRMVAAYEDLYHGHTTVDRLGGPEDVLIARTPNWPGISPAPMMVPGSQCRPIVDRFIDKPLGQFT